MLPKSVRMGASCHCRVARVAHRNHQQSARSLQEPRAAVRDLLCSRMPAPACVLADGECRAGLQWLAPKAERGTDRCGPY